MAHYNHRCTRTSSMNIVDSKIFPFKYRDPNNWDIVNLHLLKDGQLTNWHARASNHSYQQHATFIMM